MENRKYRRIFALSNKHIYTQKKIKVMSNKEKYNELIDKKQFKEACLFALDISEQELPKSSIAANNVIRKAALAIKLSGNDTFAFYLALGIETPNSFAYPKAKEFVNSLNFSQPKK